MVLLELRRDSRVMTGNLGFLLLALKSDLPFGLRGGAGDCARVTAGQKSPRHAHGDLTNLALHERLHEFLIIPREETHTSVFSVVSNSFETPWTVSHQAPLSMGGFRKEYWSGLPFPLTRIT